MAKTKNVEFHASKVRKSINYEYLNTKIPVLGPDGKPVINIATGEPLMRYPTEQEATNLYYKGKLLNREQRKTYNKYLKRKEQSKINAAIKKENKAAKAPRGINANRYSKGTNFMEGRYTAKWARAQTLRGGANPNYNWSRATFLDEYGAVGKTKGKWGGDVNNRSKKWGANNGSTVLKGLPGFIRHLQITTHQLMIQSEHFRMAVAKQALHVFQTSFAKEQFYSNGEIKWHPLSEYTRRKRKIRNTGSKILDEYGDLKSSLEIDDTSGPNQSTVYTKKVPANLAKHKKYSICYAGYHNEGEGHYGRVPKRYIKRQFIGHSSHLDPLTNGEMKRLVTRYLFDSVFLIKEF